MILGRVGWIVTLLGASASCRPELRYRTPSELGAPSPSSSGANAADRTPGAAARPADREIGLAVRRALDADPGIQAHRVDVTVESGVVTLTGTVTSGLAAERALARAENTRGVLEARSRLVVAPPAVPDAELEHRVRTVLAEDPATRDSAIAVSVRRGEVTLRGPVASRAHAAIASRASLGIYGVSTVRSRLTLPRARPRSDASIQRAVERRLTIDAYLYDQPIRVRVRSGVVRLEGAVARPSLERRARELAAQTASARVNHAALRVDGAGSALGANRIASPSGRWTREAVLDVLRHDPRLSGSNVEVDVRGGTVTLSGVVTSLCAKIAAERDALDVVGVWNVENALRVRPPLDVEDETVAEHVRERLQWDALTAGHELRVEVRNGMAVLSGNLRSRDLASQAELVVASVPGLIAVDNRIATTGHGGAARDDNAIESEIEARLRWDARVDASRISVDVRDAVAFLRGDVASRAGYEAILENAFAAGPREVVVALRRDAVASER